MIKVERFVNQLMTSNCYVVVDEESMHCLCIDPASEKSEREIAYIEGKGFILDYILLTHEHTDHTWGVNALIEKYPSVKVICSELCKIALPKETKTYFQFYYDDPNYTYNVSRVDSTTEDLGWQMEWNGHNVVFIATPGHSSGSVCICIDDVLFGGDTLMPFKPFVKKRNGGSQEEYRNSLLSLQKMFALSITVFPGHGESMSMEEMLPYYSSILE